MNELKTNGEKVFSEDRLPFNVYDCSKFLKFIKFWSFP